MNRKEHTSQVAGISLFRWAPRAPLPLRPHRYFRWTKQLPFAPVVQNFGDLLSEDIVKYVVAKKGLSKPRLQDSASTQRLLAIGSIIQFLEPGDIVWGSGVNGKHITDLRKIENITYHAVRGPLSRELLQQTGFEVPAVYGDPGLLSPLAFPKEHLLREDLIAAPVTLIPNLNDLPRWQSDAARLGSDFELVSPMGTSAQIIQKIVNSQAVVTSSLHGFVLAEVYGVPRALVVSGEEPLFKYKDYFAGTGRDNLQVFPTIENAVKHLSDDELKFDVQPLLEAFPDYLWENTDEN
ncbi:polysaccharide pyruvyl transferase family protein [Rothia aerolata]|uniref:polysaccharide pyruvyl transferase family protein n=1 Tax=Rothia aerolata TaxID=1812262 RepID=UPI001666CD84|nr:polysaccharide pyruvyl transferase family protein [Rothia aerolata]